MTTQRDRRRSRVFTGSYLTFRVDNDEDRGSRAERDVVGHPGAVAILAVDPDGECSSSPVPRASGAFFSRFLRHARH